MIHLATPERAQQNGNDMEHVKFVAPVPASDILALARSMLGPESLQVNSGQHPFAHVVGVSDGRHPAHATLCFVDKMPKQDIVDGLQRALVITNPALASDLRNCSLLVVPDARAFFIDMLTRLETTPGFCCFTTSVATPPGIDPTADIHRMAVIEAGVLIEAGARIAAGCVIKRGAAIGRGVTIRENTVIGGHGIAIYRALDGRLLRFPNLAGVIIEDGVEIGTSCSLPGGILTSTFVGRESVIGNLCNVGHAAKIGTKVWMSVGTLIGGNSSIGAGSTLGLGVSVRDNVQIGCNCSIGMGSAVMRHLPDGTSVLGNPARRLPNVSAGPQR